jgi:iron-sulfur cluster assembly protein
MMTITPQAADQIRRAAEHGGMQGMSLRVAAKRGDDGDIDYTMGFDDLGDEDVEYTLAGIPVLISELSKDLLAGVTLDYVELAPGEFQFIFVPKRNEQGDIATGSPP